MGNKNARGKSRGKHSDRRGGRAGRRRGRKGLTFGFLMMILFMLAGMGVFMVAMHQGVISKDLSATRLEQKISSEKDKQKSLRVALARLKSPGRITREATDKLGLSEPSAVIYLKYTKDGNGNIICQSNYETTTEEPTNQSGQQQQQQQPLKNGKKQASIKAEPSPNITGR